MDAVKFINEKERMCNVVECCDCDLFCSNNGEGSNCDIYVIDNPLRAVEIVERWSIKNPHSTPMIQLRKVFPDLLESTIMQLCPTAFKSSYECCMEFLSCSQCKDSFWNSEITESD